MGMSIKSISSAFHVSRNTVRKYVRRYQESGLTPEQLLSMREGKLQELFLDNCNRSRSASPRMEELEALIPEYVKRLSRKGVTVKSLCPRGKTHAAFPTTLGLIFSKLQGSRPKLHLKISPLKKQKTIGKEETILFISLLSFLGDFG